MKKMKKWANKASLPKTVYVEGVGKIQTRRKGNDLVREVIVEKKKTMRVKGQVKNVIKVEKKVFQGKNSTIPMKHFPIDKDSAGRGMWKILERPAKSVVVEERVEDGTDYLNSVDRIAEPPGFVKIRGTSGKGKTEMLQRYPGRAVYQPTKIVKEGGAVERELDDWMVRTWDWQERKTKQLKQPKPSSAPTTNLKSSQRVERNR